MRGSSVFRAGRVALLSIGVALAPLTARAEPSAADRETARQLVDDGDKKLAANDNAGALKAYQGAHAIMGVPTTGIEVVKVLMSMAQLVEARDVALQVARIPTKPGEPAVFGQARTRAEELEQKISQRIPALRLRISGARSGAELLVKVDDAVVPTAALELPRRVNPGKHTVSVAASGLTAAKDVSVVEGETKDVDLVLGTAGEGASSAPGPETPSPLSKESPAPAAARVGSTARSPLVYVGFGVGAAGIAVGSITGVMSLSRASSAKENCDGNTCPLANREDADASKSLATVSNVSFAIGLLGAGVGIYGLLAAPSASPPAPAASNSVQVRPLLGMGWAGLAGAF